MCRRMMKSLLLAFGIVAVAAPAAAQPTYRALGTEPFWSITIGGGRIVYDDAEGRRVSVATPRPMIPRYLGRQYETPRLYVDIHTGQPCSDGMSDRRYADTVRVIVDGRRLEGCGGAILPPATLAGTSWRIESINGHAVPGNSDRYRMAFEANRLTGRAGCNRFSGPYSVDSDGFQAGPLMMTRMACPGPAMAHERGVAELLRGRVRLSHPDGETLVMRVSAREIRLKRLLP
jgi:heat shock protein HslJ